jgi:hypothetical protein
MWRALASAVSMTTHQHCLQIHHLACYRSCATLNDISIADDSDVEDLRSTLLYFSSQLDERFTGFHIFS